MPLVLFGNGVLATIPWALKRLIFLLTQAGRKKPKNRRLPLTAKTCPGCCVGSCAAPFPGGQTALKLEDCDFVPCLP